MTRQNNEIRNAVRMMYIFVICALLGCQRVQQLNDEDTGSESEQELLTVEEYYLTICTKFVECEPPDGIEDWWSEFESVESCIADYEKDDVPKSGDDEYDVWYAQMVWMECMYQLPCDKIWDENFAFNYCLEEKKEYCNEFEAWSEDDSTFDFCEF